jgi:arsenate reductase (glutaredoxin)
MWSAESQTARHGSMRAPRSYISPVPIATRPFRNRTVPPIAEVQIFGVKKNAETRKALRFFAERRVKTHFVDLTVRAASLGELRRFAQRFGARALVDDESRRFDELGLRYATYSDDRWLEKLADDPLLLRMPLVRQQNRLTVGDAEPDWKRWVSGE